MNGAAVRRFAAVLAAACLMHASVAVGQTPEQEQLWEAQRAQRQADQKAAAERLAEQRAARKADPMAWVRTLDPMTSGGWAFRAVAPDGSWAAFSTEHQMKRSGHLVTAWLRQEYPESQRSGADAYMSDVQKVQYDCARERARVLLSIYYAANNLAGGQQSEEADLKQLPWDSVVPGTQSELLFHWACDAGSAGTRP